jgi:hydrogenase nickel incorporation protein HypA/HybF
VHELSICEAMLRQVEGIAHEHNARRVVKIHIQVGPLSGVELPLLERAFPLAVAGTIAADAELVAASSPVRVRCRKCGAEGTRPPNRLVCPECETWEVDITSGRELLLARVELVT